MQVPKKKKKSYAHQCFNDEIKQNNAFKNLVKDEIDEKKKKKGNRRLF